MRKSLTAAGAIALQVLLSASHLGVKPAEAQATGERRDSAAVDSTDPHAAQPERPTVATHAYTVAPGFAELETGIQVARPTAVDMLSAPIVLKVGIDPSLQLDLASGYERYAAGGFTTSGQTDFSISLKQRVLRHALFLADFSIQASVKFPTGARGVTTHTTDFSALLISSRLLGPIEMDLNAGYTRRSGDGSNAPVNSTLLTASFSGALAGPLGATLELFSYPATSGPSGSPTAVGSTAALTYQLQKWLVLDAGAMINVRNLGTNAFVAGFTWNLGRIPGFPTRSTAH